MKVQETKKQEVDKVLVEEIPKEYRTLLSPCNIPAGDTSHLAVDDLKFALEQSDSRNIAVTGFTDGLRRNLSRTNLNENHGSETDP